jgi:hypothetical protein
MEIRTKLKARLYQKWAEAPLQLCRTRTEGLIDMQTSEMINSSTTGHFNP